MRGTSSASAAVALAVSLLLMSCAPKAGTAGEPPPPPPNSERLDSWLEGIVEQNGIPGLSVLVLRGETVAARGVAGIRKTGSPEPITRSDPFHLGSNTKSMTATLAAMFVEEGKLQWSTTLGEVFGAEVPGMNPAWKNVTLQQLLTHHAGMAPNLERWKTVRLAVDRSPPRQQRREIVAEILSRAPLHPPGTRFEYSNLGFTVAGAMLETISDRAWEDLMRERLFAPLGMTSGGFGVPGTHGKVDAPWGHTSGGRPMQSDNPAAIGPAGTVHLTLEDWARFVALHLRGDPRNPHPSTRLLSAESFAHLHHPAAGENYVCGWVCTTRPEAKGNRPGDTGAVIWHNGSNRYWYCVMTLAPEIDFAVLVGANRHDPATVKACHEITRLLLEQRARSR